VPWGLAGALAAALAYGTATVLQAAAVRRTRRATALDPRLLIRLARQWRYVLGLVLDLAGFGLSLAALRTLQLFVVQAIVASSLAFTAVLAVAFLDARLGRLEWLAIVVVSCGLVLLAFSAGAQKPGQVSLDGRFALLAAVCVVGVVAAVMARESRSGHSAGSLALGVLAGLCYGMGAIGARVLSDPDSVAGLLGDPALWAMVLAGLLALLLYAQALQRGRSVTVVTAAIVATETLMPAAVGTFLLSDHTRRGFGGVSVAGFALTVAGALALARRGEVDRVTPSAPSPPSSTAVRTGRSRDRSVR
jgi:drug/metabolite transporter (DMT)-like permease